MAVVAKAECSIWITTLNGVPQQLVWGIYKTEAEEPDPARRRLARVLKPDQLVANGWDAVSTAWRRVPELVSKAIFAHPSSVVTLVGRKLTVSGAEYDLDDAGRACLDPEHDPEAPDVVVVDQDAIVTLVAALGVDHLLVEKTTLKTIHVHAVQDPATPNPPGANSGLYRQTSNSQVVRAEA